MMRYSTNENHLRFTTIQISVRTVFKSISEELFETKNLYSQQGSVLGLLFFNIYLNDLLIKITKIQPFVLTAVHCYNLCSLT